MSGLSKNEHAINRTLWNLLSEMAPEEFSSLSFFLDAPVFNSNDHLNRLFDLLRQNLDKKETDPPAKAMVWKKLFPGKPHNDPYLRRLCSDLYRLARQMMAYRRFEQSAWLPASILLETFLEPSAEKHFNKVVQEIAPVLHSEADINADLLLQRYQYAMLRHRQLERKESRTMTLQYLEEADYWLDCYYWLQKLQHYCDALGYRSILSTETGIVLSAADLQRLSDSPYAREPLIKAYLWVVKLLTQPAEETVFFELKAFLKNEGLSLSPAEREPLFIHLKNYCIRTKINQGRTEYFGELFDLFRTQLDQGLLLRSGVLLPQDYKNIITVALHAKAFTWVERFIQDYTAKLPAENQENALNYNLANVYFHQGKYDLVIEQLREVEYRDVVYALGGKLMLLKTYYELREDQAMDSLIDSFRIYLQRNKVLTREKKQQYLNVLRFVRKLTQVNIYDKTAVEKVKQQISACSDLPDRWVLQKAEELLASL